ncbi:MAG: hypothetical protein J0I99_00840 [Devosia sp.]|uniref:hypothetical protein n=1 Tax=Devosia sp. TaxID=1871048 RepID=UPI001ACD8B3F|nr:hypothetical protein [Devosia sp.]MBN9309007.1 hypothetical protein [Devosia sp.]MBN9314264.1 hypothetical protein [Devosia sp.]
MIDLKLLGVAGAVIVGMLAYNHWVENPGIAKLAKEQEAHACTIRVTDAANRARQAAEAHYQAVGEAALEEFRKTSEARDSLHRQVQNQLEEDIANYEQTLEAAGRSCKLDRSDFEWLRK